MVSQVPGASYRHPECLKGEVQVRIFLQTTWKRLEKLTVLESAHKVLCIALGA